MKGKLLVICGPTATGKTGLALHLAKKFKSELVSADSRHVYKGMDIGTGKDIPKGFIFKISQLRFNSSYVGCYTDGDTGIWGYDLVEPSEDFSVSQYVKITRNIIKDIWRRNKLPILVGGNGLYIKAVVDGIPTASIPKNKNLRVNLGGKSIEELYNLLTVTDPVKAGSLNISDRKNPRRIIRAIEIALSKPAVVNQESGMILNSNVLFLGLILDKKGLDFRIRKRINKRLKQGLLEEIRKLLSLGLRWENQSLQAFGYKEWKSYLSGKETKTDVIQKWIIDERNYAKSQINWFKRDKRINWFEASSVNLLKSVEKLVRKWHNKTN